MLSSISDIGLSKKTNWADVKHIQLTNWLIFLSINISIVYGIAHFSFNVTNAAIIEILAIVVYSSLLIISYFNYFRSARFLFIIALYFHMMARSFCYGETSQIHLLLIPIATIALILFDLKEKVIIFTLMLIGIASFTLLYIFHFQASFTTELPTALLNVIRFTSYLTAISTQGFVMYDLISQYEKNEKFLDKNNVLLQEQFKSVFENSYNALFLADCEDRKIVKVNKRALELFEAEKEEELMNKYGVDFHAVRPTEEQRLMIGNILFSTGKYADEVLYRTQKNNTFWGALTITLFDIDGRKYQSISIADITKEKQSREQIQAALHEKKILLAEIHHRVKNNMAVITGLLGLQANFIEDEKARSMFKESCNRIHSMALIHDKLYRSESLAKIDFTFYINDLVNHITSSYNDSTTKIKYNINCNNVFVNIKNAVPCGLILNELLSNIYKHAFKNKSEGEFKIECTEEAGCYTIIVKDNGHGFDYEQIIKKNVSLGLTLVSSLAEQLNAKLQVINNNGTIYYITFKE